MPLDGGAGRYGGNGANERGAPAVAARPGLREGGRRAAKTDKVDARVLAAFGAAFPDMAATVPADVTADRLRDMLVPCEALVDRRTELRAVLGEVGDPDPDPDGPVQRVLAELDAAVREFDRRIERPVRGSGDLAGSYAILTSSRSR